MLALHEKLFTSIPISGFQVRNVTDREIFRNLVRFGFCIRTVLLSPEPNRRRWRGKFQGTELA